MNNTCGCAVLDHDTIGLKVETLDESLLRFNLKKESVSEKDAAGCWVEEGSSLG